MKIGIITMHKVVNYGSALQAYALQHVLEKAGHDCTLIDYQYPNPFYWRKNRKKRIKSILTRNWILWILNKINHKNRSKSKCIELFESFWREYFHLSEKFNTIEELEKSYLFFDARIVGSDQVWNPQTMFGDPVYFFQFGDKKSPLISYASSFSIDKIDGKYKRLYKKYLDTFTALSVREKSGINIIKELLNREAVECCDPTLLIETDDYKEIASKSTLNIEGEYLFAYVLRYAFNPHPAVDMVIDEISKKYNLKVVYLGDDDSMLFRPNTTFISGIGPSEFLYLIENASFVVTSSFHGTIFSQIFKRQFYSIVPSRGYDSRISSFLSKVGRDDRCISADDMWTIGKDKPLKFEMTDQLLEDYIIKSREFLFGNLL